MSHRRWWLNPLLHLFSPPREARVGKSAAVSQTRPAFQPATHNYFSPSADSLDAPAFVSIAQAMLFQLRRSQVRNGTVGCATTMQCMYVSLFCK
jgi:hypothetical protein